MSIVHYNASPTQAPRTGFYPVPHQLRLDLIRLNAPPGAKALMDYVIDKTAGWRCLYVLLSQGDVLNDPDSGLGSTTTVSKAFHFCLEHHLLTERSFPGYGTGYMLARHYWALMLAEAPNILPKWLVKIGPERKFWPPYDARLDPLTDETPLASETKASNRHVTETPAASEIEAGSIRNQSKRSQELKQVAIRTEAGCDAAGQDTPGTNSSVRPIDTYKDTYQDKIKDNIPPAAGAPVVAQTHVDLKKEAQRDEDSLSSMQPHSAQTSTKETKAPSPSAPVNLPNGSHSHDAPIKETLPGFAVAPVSEAAEKSGRKRKGFAREEYWLATEEGMGRKRPTNERNLNEWNKILIDFERAGEKPEIITWAIWHYRNECVPKYPLTIGAATRDQWIAAAKSKGKPRNLEEVSHNKGGANREQASATGRTLTESERLTQKIARRIIAERQQKQVAIS